MTESDFLKQIKTCRLLDGNRSEIPGAVERWAKQAVDMEWPAPDGWEPPRKPTTIAKSFYVSGPGTYSKRDHSTLYFEPETKREGWWIDRTDLNQQLPIAANIRNVWETKRSIVLRSGSASNYLRMVEHIVALRLGLGLDNVTIRTGTGDPPLFNEGSTPLVEHANLAQFVALEDRELTYRTVSEPVTLLGNNGSFLHFSPAEPGDRLLHIDCAVDFPTFIGQQRIQFDLHPKAFAHGARARTNCKAFEWWLVRTVGKIFADYRNLGYTRENILIAGKNSYANQPKLIHNDKSLEAVWHRATLDLIAALSLIENGRLAGRIVSYKAGHELDVRLVNHLFLHDLLVPVS